MTSLPGRQVQAFLAPGKGQLTVFASEGRRIIGTVVQEKGIIYTVNMLILTKTAEVFSKPSKRKLYEVLRHFNFHPRILFLHKLVLGIETSCDDTAAAVVDETGNVLGEAIHSQTEVHLNCFFISFRTGGIILPVAQQLHRENIQRIVQEALSASNISPSDLSAIATTVKPGLALSLGVGLSFSLKLVDQFRKPFIPIHHMEAHALTIRLTNKVEFPFLVLLISGGHCLLALVRGVSDFLLLGKSLDIAPGDMLDKTIMQKEKEEGIEKGQILSSAADIAAAVQHTIACHIAKRTHRAILFCKQRDLLCQSNAVLVVSGGVASNLYIRKALEIVTDATQCTLLCPPPRLCTDNGIMIAWNGVERLRAGLGILHNTEGIRYEPKYVVPFIIFMQFAFESQSLDFAFICEVFIDILVILEEGLH
ncbi:probable tRNA N6-adenosine threonylcarbamoyltransferase, mitochondrial isoform X6 [Camelus ferus]|uniref:N(6)-L-threonylcarbamoyladenine synthase n=2 Tax=Camelus TaxID=9836 RepID=A0A8B8T142_CAMFR|nr:probable tRNA N6-adenosine threonylcarbamoyltransferase, mitochondrial isoform X6 [Camelus ferus]XP_045376405.1 probable tRNA N6-adenosine threonylcarbamoyltransferase, mitochondrial isoform X6 [Camelus bactrianus]